VAWWRAGAWLVASWSFDFCASCRVVYAVVCRSGVFVVGSARRLSHTPRYHAGIIGCCPWTVLKPLATHLLELQPEEQRREANSLASSKARKLLSKKRTTQQPQPDDLNPNTAESMGEGGHRAAPGPAYGPVAKGSWLLEREEYTYSGFQHCIISL
jgi:hypothetical protein